MPEVLPPGSVRRELPGDRSQVLTLADLETILSTVRKDVMIVFSGFSEPFGNRETTGMVQYANEAGYRLALFTTLNGAQYDVDELCRSS